MGNICTHRPMKNQQLTINMSTQRNFKIDDQRSLFVTEQYQTFKSINIRQNQDQNQSKQNNQNVELQQKQNKIFEAKENNDIQYLIDYINDDQKLEQPYDINHPWANPPNSIGSIATMLISIFFMRELTPDQIGFEEQEIQILKYVQYFQNQNVVQKLKKNLYHQEIDRVHINILLLVFLVEFQELHQVLIQNQIFDYTLKLLNGNQDNSLGFRLASGYVLRELFKNNKKLEDRFIDDQQALNTISEFLENYDQQYIMEGLNIIEDLITDQDNQINLANCKKLYDFGFFIKLQKIQIRLEIELQEDNSDLEQQEVKQVSADLIKTLMTRLLSFSKKK